MTTWRSVGVYSGRTASKSRRPGLGPRPRRAPRAVACARERQRLRVASATTSPRLRELESLHPWARRVFLLEARRARTHMNWADLTFIITPLICALAAGTGAAQEKM